MLNTSATSTADLIRAYWYLIVRNPLWLAGLIPGVDPRTMTARDVLQAATAYMHQEQYTARHGEVSHRSIISSLIY